MPHNGGISGTRSASREAEETAERGSLGRIREGVERGGFRERFASERGFRSEPFERDPFEAFIFDPNTGGFQTPQEFAETPFGFEEFMRLRRQFGPQFTGVGPLTRQRFEFGAGVIGAPRGAFSAGGARRGLESAAIPPFLSGVFDFGENETLGQLINRARAGARDFQVGGPNAPKILSPAEFNKLLPSEQEGLLGFLEFVGIPPEDYLAAVRQQQDRELQRFSPTIRAARQR